MNILTIKTGNYYDSDYSEYIFRTNRSKREFYDENFNLTEWFLTWLRKNHTIIYNEYFCDRKNFEVDYYHEDSIELIS